MWDCQHGGDGNRKMVNAGGGCTVALFHQMAFLEFQCVFPQIFGDVLHHHFHSKERLRRTKPTVRTAGCCVRLERSAVYMKIFDIVHAIGTNNAALEYYGGQRRIGAGVKLDIDVHRCYFSVLYGSLIGA